MVRRVKHGGRALDSPRRGVCVVRSAWSKASSIAVSDRCLLLAAGEHMPVLLLLTCRRGNPAATGSTTFVSVLLCSLRRGLLRRPDRRSLTTLRTNREARLANS
jgi:hypothetical protein